MRRFPAFVSGFLYSFANLAFFCELRVLCVIFGKRYTRSILDKTQFLSVPFRNSEFSSTPCLRTFTSLVLYTGGKARMNNKWYLVPYSYLVTLHTLSERCLQSWPDSSKHFCIRASGHNSSINDKLYTKSGYHGAWVPGNRNQGYRGTLPGIHKAQNETIKASIHAS